MDTREVLYSFIKRALGGNSTPQLSPLEITEAQLLSQQQGVSAIAFEGFMESRTEWQNGKLAEIEQIKLQWLGDTAFVVESFNSILKTQQYISKQLKAAGIKALVLKGTALARYYDTNDFRQFGDIDIYSPTEFERIDDLLKKIGENYDLECYRHSHCTVKGITVENHIFLTDARWKKKWGKLEEYLFKETDGFLQQVDETGLCYPDDLFTIIFYLYHTQAHFVYEQMSVRFLLDWYYLLKNRKQIDEAALESRLKDYKLLKIAGYVTALCVKKLDMPENIVPRFIINELKDVPSALLLRFENDMFDTSHTGFSSNTLKDRVKRMMSFYHNRWKIQEFLGMSVYRFIWEKITAILLNKK